MSEKPGPGLLAALEALLDDRVGALPDALKPELRAQAEALASRPEAAREALTLGVRSRPLVWGAHRLTQGELLDGFARHCADDLEDVVVEEHTPTTLVARWRSEVSRIELRAGTIGLERLAGGTPTLVLTDLENGTDALVTRFLDEPELRARLALFDPVILEKLGAVRSSVFVYLEWHLRDAYGVKVLPSPAFTRGLVDRGVISLGMG